MKSSIAKKQGLEVFVKRQHGYFTSTQAAVYGYSNKTFFYHIKNHDWLQIDYKLYRLPNFEDTLESSFTRWSLWSRNKDEQPQGVISHESALMYYEMINSNMDSPVHLTVPKGFRKRNIPTDGLVLHKDNLSLSDLENHGSFMTTKLFRTLQDTKEELESQGKWNEVADRATKSGKLTESELLKLGIITTDSKMLNTSGNNLSGGLYLGKNGQVQSDEVYYRAQDAQKIFESMEKQGRWAMSASSFGGSKSSQRGFTLVELLVVIAVISVLAGMLLPVLENAADQARSIHCINNLKQAGVALSLYIDDYDGYICANANPSSGSWTERNLWSTYLVDEYTNGDVMYCHSAPPYEYLKFRTYGFLAWVDFRKFDKVNWKILLADTTYAAYTDFCQVWMLNYYNINHMDFTGAYIYGRHGGRANCLMDDFHVSSASPDEIMFDSAYNWVRSDGRTFGFAAMATE
jgi:prepilin-type N-terminal cleavage/methylation domain-containing protein/prepilin-type processing-associated H-X9-DG protein